MFLIKFLELANFLIFFQGIVFGSRYIFLYVKQKNKALLFLGIFIFSITIGSLKFIVNPLFGIYSKPLELLPTYFFFLGVISYSLYVKEILQLNPNEKQHLLLIGIITEFLFIYLFYLFGHQNLFLGFILYDIYFIIGCFFNISFLLFLIFLIKKQLKDHQKQYSTPQIKKISIVKKITFSILLLIISVTLITLITLIFIPSSIVLDGLVIFFKSFILILIYWTSLKKELLINKQKNISLKKDDLHKTFIIIDTYFKESTIYNNSDITPFNISKATQIPTQKVSEAINYATNLNFKSYVNQLRIQRALTLLKNPKFKNYTMDAIGVEVGFKSKTTFYRAFKKEMNCTPIEYKS